MSAAQTQITTLRTWDGELAILDGAYAGCEVPFTGFSVIEANDLDEVIQLAAWAACSKSEEAIGKRTVNDSSWESRTDLILHKLEARKEMPMTTETRIDFAACYPMY